MGLYRIILATHLVAVISWMAGLLYIFRLFVYHAMETEEIVKSRFCVMEKRLLRIITLPAALVSLGCGVAMLIMNPELMHQGWMHAKLFFVVCLLALTHYAGTFRRALAAGTSKHSDRFFRVMNEVPTVLMIVIVFLVILRPF